MDIHTRRGRCRENMGLCSSGTSIGILSFSTKSTHVANSAANHLLHIEQQIPVESSGIIYFDDFIGIARRRPPIAWIFDLGWEVRRRRGTSPREDTRFIGR